MFPPVVLDFTLGCNRDMHRPLHCLCQAIALPCSAGTVSARDYAAESNAGVRQTAGDMQPSASVRQVICPFKKAENLLTAKGQAHSLCCPTSTQRLVILCINGHASIDKDKAPRVHSM